MYACNGLLIDCTEAPSHGSLPKTVSPGFRPSPNSGVTVHKSRAQVRAVPAPKARGRFSVKQVDNAELLGIGQER